MCVCLSSCMCAFVFECLGVCVCDVRMCVYVCVCMFVCLFVYLLVSECYSK